MGIWDKIKKCGNYQVICEQDDMAEGTPYGYADTWRGARAIKKANKKKYPSLTYTVRKKDKKTGFWD